MTGVDVVIENGGNAGDEIRVVRDLCYDVEVYSWLFVEVPYYDGVNFAFLAEVNCYVLFEWSKLYEASV